ncbi:hypothetical protein BCR44DRAFT_152019 [Catenaria anguillulae PL171]|uniref:Uncharacterized protein n=1 Tax=Catenaria anguillulae PL171 TaxID=765915 RepID=A0A1Y2HYN3_9FUNG|nr:hypothetical protein BCR44DRAFT_152019 [Catenaria anguillulae PL171]
MGVRTCLTGALNAIWNVKEYIIIIGIAVTLVIDHYLPTYNQNRFLTASYAASALTIISSYASSVLCDLYARNALKVMLQGTTREGVLMQISYAALSDGVLSIATRTLSEAKTHGTKKVGTTRFLIVFSSVVAFCTSTIWGWLSANFVTDTVLSKAHDSQELISSVNINNPFGMASCASALTAGNVSFTFNSGPSVPLGEMLEAVYSTTLVSSDQAVRNATAPYLDDFIQVQNSQGLKLAVMIPLSPTHYTRFRTTLVGVNVTCAIKTGDKTMGSLSNATGIDVTPTFTLPVGFTDLLSQTVQLKRGYAGISDLSNDVISRVTANPSIMAIPECSFGVCEAFAKDLIFGLRCGVAAYTMDVTVTKGIPESVRQSLGTSPSAADLANAQRTSITIHSTSSAPAVVAFMRNALSGWSTALQWSWLARTYRFIPDPATYIYRTTETNVVRDYEVMLSYAILGLIHRNQTYKVQLTGTANTAGCAGVVTAGNTALVQLSTPAYSKATGTVLVTKNFAQTSYSWPVAVFAGILGGLLLILLPPVTTPFLWLQARRRKSSPMSTVPLVPSTIPGAAPAGPDSEKAITSSNLPPINSTAVLQTAISSGAHGFATSVQRLLEDSEAEGKAGGDVFLIVPQPTKSDGVVLKRVRSAASKAKGGSGDKPTAATALMNEKADGA